MPVNELSFLPSSRRRVTGRRTARNGSLRFAVWRIVENVLALGLASVLSSGATCAQSQTPLQSQPSQKQDADKPAPACAKILLMTSSEWVANVATIDKASLDAQLRAIRIYGGCYDARTKHLASAVSKTGKGPSASARGDFDDFENAVKDFTKKALAIANPAADSLKTAYVSLYEKQFRYAFYQRYEPRNPITASPSSKTATHPHPVPASPNNSLDSTTSANLAPSTTSDAAPKNALSKDTASDADEMTKAKNRFGELLDALPEDQLHSLHAAFGNIVGTHQMNNATQLALYRYAIFVLEPSGPAPNSLDTKPPSKPFAPPAF
jgi:hypothetical protein